MHFLIYYYEIEEIRNGKAKPKWGIFKNASADEEKVALQSFLVRPIPSSPVEIVDFYIERTDGSKSTAHSDSGKFSVAFEI